MPHGMFEIPHATLTAINAEPDPAKRRRMRADMQALGEAAYPDATDVVAANVLHLACLAKKRATVRARLADLEAVAALLYCTATGVWLITDYYTCNPTPEQAHAYREKQAARGRQRHALSGCPLGSASTSPESADVCSLSEDCETDRQPSMLVVGKEKESTEKKYQPDAGAASECDAGACTPPAPSTSDEQVDILPTHSAPAPQASKRAYSVVAESEDDGFSIAGTVASILDRAGAAPGQPVAPLQEPPPAPTPTQPATRRSAARGRPRSAPSKRRDGNRFGARKTIRSAIPAAPPCNLGHAEDMLRAAAGHADIDHAQAAQLYALWADQRITAAEVGHAIWCYKRRRSIVKIAAPLTYMQAVLGRQAAMRGAKPGTVRAVAA